MRDFLIIIVLVVFNLIILLDKDAVSKPLKKSLSYFPVKISYFNGVSIDEVPIADEQFLGVYRGRGLELKLRITYINGMTSKFGTLHEPIICYQGSGWQIVKKNLLDIEDKENNYFIYTNEFDLKLLQDHRYVLYYYLPSSESSRRQPLFRFATLYKNLTRHSTNQALIQVWLDRLPSQEERAEIIYFSKEVARILERHFLPD